jgi:putrescine transport system ATP-binding protein
MTESPGESADGGSRNPAFIRLRGLTRRFGDFTAVDAVDLDIAQGELFSILGGSGSGKTTLLRLMAGFEMPDAGSIEIDGSDVTATAPYERPVNMMFQSYALFPHMTVEQNIAYGLRRDRVAKAGIRARVDAMLDLVSLGDFRRRRPGSLSGGQQQRVALARALVKQPKVLLLDEPLAALDKKLREHTQFELASIQHETGITFVVVTHDQEEAMTLSDRIAVMDQGRFRQVGTPKEVYEFPSNRFVAEFIGTINTFRGRVAAFDGQRIAVDCDDTGTTLSVASDRAPEVGAQVDVAVRPEKIFVGTDEPMPGIDARLQGVVDDLGYLGSRSLYRVRLPTGKIVQVSSQNRRRSVTRSLTWGDSVWISWRPESAALLID